MAVRCNTCDYWQMVLEEIGQCKRHAPKIIDGLVAKVDPEADPLRNEELHSLSVTERLDVTTFPVTVGDDWCGEWKQMLAKEE